MSNVEATEVIKKELPIFILVEKSDEIYTMLRIFDVLQGVVQEIRDFEEESTDCVIKVGVYSFSNMSNFIHPHSLKTLSEFSILEVINNDIVDLTDVVSQLDNDMSKSTFLNGGCGYYVPYVIFILDGNKKYILDEALKLKNKNKWFKCAPKIAFVLNGTAFSNENEFLQLTGCKEAIIKIDDADKAIDAFGQMLTCINTSISGYVCANQSTRFDGDIVATDLISDDMLDDSWPGDDSWD